MKLVHMVAFLLVVVGALNWGLVGLFQFNLVTTLFGGTPMLEQLIYVLVGASGILILVTHKAGCDYCKKM